MKFCSRVAFLAVLTVSAFAQGVFDVRDRGEARDRTYHVVHYALEVSFDEPKKMVFGKTTITLVPFLAGVSTVELDAENMEIKAVTMGTLPLRFEVGPEKLVIRLDKTYSFGDTLNLSVQYSCTPKRGLYFVGPDSGYPDKPRQIWSQGEDMDNHHWFPCYDFPNDRATSEMSVTVRDTYSALSNGRLVSVKADKAKKTRTFHWKQEKPQVSYLIMLAAGEYAVLKDKAGDIPLEYWVYPNNVDDARVCFAQTPNMVNWFGQMIGFPYPWAKYSQVLIKDFIEGGMENTSATSLMDVSAVYDARTRVDDPPTSLIAHELAHQWWGDVVTGKDWRHLWLNESFASYFDALWHEHSLGRDEFDYIVYTTQLAGITSDKTEGRKPIVSVGSHVANVYSRGAAVLHMLRFVLGDKLFWRAIHHYITKYQYGIVETNDLKIAIEEATGQNLFWFFDQWVYKAGYPVFDLSYDWSDSAKAVFLTVRQTQTCDSLSGVFTTPVDIEVTSQEGSSTHRVTIVSKDTTITLPSSSKPTMVIFDKGNWLLKELHWTKNVEEWKRQAELAPNPIDRLRALQELVKKEKNSAFLPLFSRVALHDNLWAIRREAVAALDKVDSANQTEKSQISEALLLAAHDRKSAVRVAAVTQLRKHKGPDVIAAVQAALKDSSNLVVASALRSLVAVDSAHALPVLLAHLEVPSHRSVIASAALGAMSLIDTSRALDLSLIKGRYGYPIEVRYVALGLLRKYGKGRKDVKDLMKSVLPEKPSWVRTSAIRSLGEMGDESDLPMLHTIAADAYDTEKMIARGSIEKIQKRLHTVK